MIAIYNTSPGRGLVSQQTLIERMQNAPCPTPQTPKIVRLPATVLRGNGPRLPPTYAGSTRAALPAPDGSAAHGAAEAADSNTAMLVVHDGPVLPRAGGVSPNAPAKVHAPRLAHGEGATQLGRRAGHGRRPSAFDTIAPVTGDTVCRAGQGAGVAQRRPVARALPVLVQRYPAGFRGRSARHG